MARFQAAMLLSLLAAGLVGGRSALGEDAPASEADLPFLGCWELVSAEMSLPYHLKTRVPKGQRLQVCLFSAGLWAFVADEGPDKVRMKGGRWSEHEGTLRLRDLEQEAVAPFWMLPSQVLKDQIMHKVGEEWVIDPNWAWLQGGSAQWSMNGKNILEWRGSDAIGKALTFWRRPAVVEAGFVGLWTGGSASFEFRSDKAFLFREGPDDPAVRGTWTALDAIVSLSLEGGGVRHFGPIDMDPLLGCITDVGRDGQLALWMLRRAQAEDAPAEPRSPNPPAAPTPAPAKPGVVGVWVAPMEGGEAKITFREDGTYTREWPEGGKTRRFAGTYEVKGAELVVEDAEEPGTVLKVPFRRVGNDELELTIEGEVLRLAREGATRSGGAVPSEPVPAALHGTWLARDETGTVRLDLTPDGRFALALETPQQKWRYAGPCGAREGVLEGRDETSGGAVRFPYRQADADTIVVTISEVEFHLKRQGGAKPAEPKGAPADPPRENPKEGALPPGVLGTWSGQIYTLQGFDAGSVTLTLRPDKTYDLTWRLPGQVIPRTGTYRVQGSVLTMMAKGQGPISVEFRLEAGGLTLDAFAAMQPTTLTRNP